MKERILIWLSLLLSLLVCGHGYGQMTITSSISGNFSDPTDTDGSTGYYWDQEG
jgi:hypothetical protein